MSKQQVIDSMLAQLDSMFANKAAFEMLAADPQAPTPSADQVWDEAISLEKPATSTFMDCIIYDWGKQPYIKGGYSYPSSGATREVREDLARPIDDKVFFAGTIGLLRLFATFMKPNIRLHKCRKQSQQSISHRLIAL